MSLSIETQAEPRAVGRLDQAALVFAGILLAVSVFRITALYLNPIGLYLDEAQYWAWSRSLDWGYYTKPPLIAWVIAATTAAFGDLEWAVRLGAPIANAATALGVFALARAFYGSWAGVWAGVTWLVLPAVWLSSSVISTDAVLLPFWAAALVSLQRLVSTRAMVWAIALGLAIGIGLLAKYAMLYFVICLAVLTIWSGRTRDALGDGRGLLALALAALAVLPNLVWNLQNGFATVSHTVDNANIGAGLFHPEELAAFVASQFAVVGPLVLLALLALLYAASRTKPNETEKFLIAFTAPPLLAVTVLSFLTRANANWAVVSYVAATVWLAGRLFASKAGRRYLIVACAINAAIGMAAFAIAMNPGFSSQFRGVREARGWDVTARQISSFAAEHGPFSAVMVDHRAAFFQLGYHWRGEHGVRAPAPVRMWLLHGDPRNAAEAAGPMRPQDGRRVLVVHMSQDLQPLVAGDFVHFRQLAEVEAPLGGGRTRLVRLSLAEGYAPVPRDRAFRARLQSLQEHR